MSVRVSMESCYLFFDFTYDHIGRILFGYGSSIAESPGQLSHISQVHILFDFSIVKCNRNKLVNELKKAKIKYLFHPQISKRHLRPIVNTRSSFAKLNIIPTNVHEIKYWLVVYIPLETKGLP